ncbi:MAG: hypothetical protein KF724_04185 [Phycisphaeraceae bacterium]|nr:hypothetical protein [Phycisphaeraceae bacterium]
MGHEAISAEGWNGHHRQRSGARSALAAAMAGILGSAAPAWSGAAVSPQGQEQEQAAPAPFLTIYAAGVESLLRSPKDAWLRGAIERIETQGVQLPPDLAAQFNATPQNRVMVKLVRDLLTTRIIGSLALTGDDAEEPPIPRGQIAFLGNSRRPGADLEPNMIDAMRLSGLWSNFKPVPGAAGLFSFDQAGSPTVYFGSGPGGDGSITSLSVGMRPVEPVLDFTRFGVPATLQPQGVFELDFTPLQSLLGLGAAMMPQGPDGRSPLETLGLLSRTPMIFRAAATNDGVEGRIQARLVNAVPAMQLESAANGRTLGAKELRWIPADAQWAAMARIDLPRAFNQLVDQYNLQAALWGDDEDFMDDDESSALLGVADQWTKENLGLDLRRDIIAPLGDMVAYQTSVSMGGGVFGSAVIVGLRDAATMQRSIERLSTLLAADSSASNSGLGLRARSVPGTRAFYSFSLAGLPIPFQIVIGMTDDAMVIGFMPQTVTAAIAQASNPTSIATSPALAPLGGAKALENAHALLWFDAASSVQAGYGTLLGVATAIDSALLPQAGAPTPIATTVPPLAELARGVRPSLLVGRIDGNDLTWDYRCDGSFTVQLAAWGSLVGGGFTPMSMALASAVLSARAVDRAASVAETRGGARDMQPATELRQLGMGIMSFAASREFQFPATLDELVAAGAVKQLPRSRRDAPGLNGRIEYRAPAPSEAFNSELPMLWEGYDFWPDGGILVVFADLSLRRITDEQDFRGMPDR